MLLLDIDLFHIIVSFNITADTSVILEWVTILKTNMAIINTSSSNGQKLPSSLLSMPVHSWCRG